MSGFATLVAPCFTCGRIFASNPERVPSYGGEPICRDCIEEVNARRRAEGRPEWPVLPGAYEPAEAGGL